MNTKNQITFEYFINNCSAQSLGKFGEFLFKKWCFNRNIPCVGKHENGIDFYIENSLHVDVKALRHIQKKKKDSFRRFPADKQIFEVCYAYVIFWSDCVELRVEREDCSVGNFDCDIEENLVEQSWVSFDKTSIKLQDRSHAEFARSLKIELKSWVRHNLNLEPRIIQRKVSSKLNARKGGWGADNFFQSNFNKYQLVILLGVSEKKVLYVHSYPTCEWQNIEVVPKPVGTNRKQILCYVVDKLPSRYKFEDLNDFKKSVKKRFGF